jgi:hypothetical protein
MFKIQIFTLLYKGKNAVKSVAGYYLKKGAFADKKRSRETNTVPLHINKYKGAIKIPILQRCGQFYLNSAPKPRGT